jgi:hypothetical protein
VVNLKEGGSRDRGLMRSGAPSRGITKWIVVNGG